MAYWLLKTEPSEYSAADLQREKSTAWTGVANPTAVKHLRAMAKGDVVVIYHTGTERRCVALATVTDPARDDPSNSKSAIVELKFDAMLKTPVTLEQIKADPAFEGWDLLRIGRLSVVPTPDKMWNRLMSLSSPRGAK